MVHGMFNDVSPAEDTLTSKLFQTILHSKKNPFNNFHR